MILVDNPIKDMKMDCLSIETQVKGFSSFITTCETPLTVSIQGKWGSGKTSFFELVKANILATQKEGTSAKCKFVDFNAWQYSQFNSDSELPASLLVSLVSQIGCIDDTEEDKKDKNNKNNAKETLKLLGSIVAYAGNRFILEKTGINVIETSKTVTDGIKKTQSDMEEMVPEALRREQVVDFVGAIEKLKLSFAKNVEDCLGGDKEARLIIFVDDLDRLLPEKAIGLLEVMKIFLDCPQCVFVLAIDYDVVENGVMAKYRNTINKDKGRDYFEKMIQVVYRLPNTMSHMTDYIQELIARYNENKSNADKVINPGVAWSFTELLKAGGKDNPRGVKRLLNNFLLVRTIGIESKRYEENRRERNDVCLFAFICLQDIYPRTYAKLWNKASNVVAFVELFEQACKDNVSEGDERLDYNFFMAFKEAIDSTEGSGNLERLNKIVRVLNYSDNAKEYVAKVAIDLPVWVRELYIEDPNVKYESFYCHTKLGGIEEGFVTITKMIFRMYRQGTMNPEVFSFIKCSVPANRLNEYIWIDYCNLYVKKESDDTKYFEYIAELAEGLGVLISLKDSLDEKRKPTRVFGTDKVPDDSLTVYEEQYIDRVDFGLFFDEVEEINEDNE